MKRSSRWFKRSALLALFSLFMTSFAPFAVAADKIYFYHNDPLGTPMSVTDGNTGAVVWQADYKPFGEEQSAGDPKVNDRTFIGKEKDGESGLHYFGARYHSSEIGRFISPDPVGAVDPFSSSTNTALLANPQRLNYYAYSLNNPYKYVDHDGRFSTWAEGLGKDQSAIHAASQTPEVQMAGSIVLGIMGELAFGAILAPVLLAKRADDVAESAVTIKNSVLGKPRVGSANKIDKYHQFNDIIDNYAGYASKFDIPTKGPGGKAIRTSELRQIEGSLNSKNGVFEWIIDQGKVTHRRFIPGGKVTGFPNQVPLK